MKQRDLAIVCTNLKFKEIKFPRLPQAMEGGRENNHLNGRGKWQVARETGYNLGRTNLIFVSFASDGCFHKMYLAKRLFT